jgi:hypothetical protein
MSVVQQSVNTSARRCAEGHCFTKKKYKHKHRHAFHPRPRYSTACSLAFDDTQTQAGPHSAVTAVTAVTPAEGHWAWTGRPGSSSRQRETMASGWRAPSRCQLQHACPSASRAVALRLDGVSIGNMLRFDGAPQVIVVAARIVPVQFGPHLPMLPSSPQQPHAVTHSQKRCARHCNSCQSKIPESPHCAHSAPNHCSGVKGHVASAKQSPYTIMAPPSNDLAPSHGVVTMTVKGRLGVDDTPPEPHPPPALASD